MRKIKVILFLCSLFFNFAALAQFESHKDILLSSFIIDSGKKLSENSYNSLLEKTNSIILNNGIGNSNLFPQFVLASKINMLSKKIVAGPPAKVSIDINLVLLIGKADENLLFNQKTIRLSGIGENENLAISSAINQLETSDPTIVDFVTKSKVAMVDYFTRNCDLILSSAKNDSYAGDINGALYKIGQIPMACTDCYKKSLIVENEVFQNKIDLDGKVNLNLATLAWNTSKNKDGAIQALNSLKLIHPNSSSFNKIENLMGQISKRLDDNELRNWALYIKKYEDKVYLERFKLNAEREAVLAYYNSLPKTFVYNNTTFFDFYQKIISW
jgi:CRISPR/Cas system CMR-associated protein Cmr5 small subunit